MLRSVPNPRRESTGTVGRKENPLNLSRVEAELLVNGMAFCWYAHKRNHDEEYVEVHDTRFAFKSRQVYVFRSDSAGGWHAYRIFGNE